MYQPLHSTYIDIRQRVEGDVLVNCRTVRDRVSWYPILLHSVAEDKGGKKRRRRSSNMFEKRQSRIFSSLTMPSPLHTENMASQSDPSSVIVLQLYLPAFTIQKRHIGISCHRHKRSTCETPECTNPFIYYESDALVA